MSAKDFSVVNRPVVGSGLASPNPITAALVETVTTGKAVRISLNGEARLVILNRFRTAMSVRKLRLRSQVDGDALVMWAEKKQAREER